MDIITQLPHPTQLAFATCCPLRTTALIRPISTAPIRRRPRTRPNTHARLESFPDTEPNGRVTEGDDDVTSYEDLFVDQDERSFWEDVNVRTSLRPITEEEKAALRAKLPLRVANFLIRRAEDADRLREPGAAEESFFGKLLKDLPPDLPDEEDEEYRDYVFETVAGPPAFRRRPSLFGGGDGLPDVEDNSMDDAIDVGPPKNVMSMFVGRVGSVDEQAAQVGYGLLALFAAWVLFKIFFALIAFFVSFTFSFFAIFALSAGIFMVFFFFRW